jgi:hypothetical protein
MQDVTVIEDVTITATKMEDGRTRHYATLPDGDWIATYVDPPDERGPWTTGFYWDSLESFYSFIRAARRS